MHTWSIGVKETGSGKVCAVGPGSQAGLVVLTVAVES
jgi:hypothetical protein